MGGGRGKFVSIEMQVFLSRRRFANGSAGKSSGGSFPARRKCQRRTRCEADEHDREDNAVDGVPAIGVEDFSGKQRGLRTLVIYNQNNTAFEFLHTCRLEGNAILDFVEQPLSITE